MRKRVEKEKILFWIGSPAVICMIHMEFDTSKSKFGNPASIGAMRERLKTILRKKFEKKGRKGENFILDWFASSNLYDSYGV